MSRAEQDQTLRPLEDSVLPFEDLEYSDGALIIQGHLATLELNFESTASNVRGVAVSLRLSDSNKGTTRFQRASLRWALSQTENCITEDEFRKFFYTHMSFEQIAEERVKRSIRRLADNEKPFEKLVEDTEGVEAATKSAVVISRLSQFGLKYTDTAGDARFFVTKAIHEHTLNDQDSIANLTNIRWLLSITGDIQNDEQFAELVLDPEEFLKKLKH